MGIIGVLKFPLKFLAGLLRKGRKKVKNELVEKQQAYVQNFDPTRLKNRSWQKGLDKDKQKKKKRESLTQISAKEQLKSWSPCNFKKISLNPLVNKWLEKKIK